MMEKDKEHLDYRAELYASEMKRIEQERIIYILSAIALVLSIFALVLIVRNTGVANVASAA